MLLYKNNDKNNNKKQDITHWNEKNEVQLEMTNSVR